MMKKDVAKLQTAIRSVDPAGAGPDHKTPRSQDGLQRRDCPRRICRRDVAENAAGDNDMGGQHVGKTIDYAGVTAKTVAGIIGVKVWIYKGENN